jgi:WD40 repeat protein
VPPELPQFRGHQDLIITVAFAPDGKTLASGSHDGSVRLWDVAAGTERPPFGDLPLGMQNVVFGPGQTVIAPGDGAVHIWDLTEGKQHRLVQQGVKGWSDLAVSSDGRTLAVAGTEGDTVCLWDLARREAVRRLQKPAGAVHGLTFAPDGKVLAAGVGKSIQRWEATTGQVLPPLAGAANTITALAFSPDGKTLASAEEYGAMATKVRQMQPKPLLRLWDAASGKELRQLGEQRFGVYSLAFSADGRTLLAGSGPDAHLGAWDVATGKEVRQPLTFEGNAQTFARSPDGRAVALVGGDAIVVADLVTGKERRRFQGQRGWVQHLAFSARGDLLATVNKHSVLVWDVAGLGLAGRAKNVELGQRELETLWNDLASAEDVTPYQAVWRLAADAGRSVPFLKERLRPVHAADPQQTERWIKDLDSDQFAVRDKAGRELEALEETAAPALRKVLQGQPSAEARRRANELLEKLSSPVPRDERLRSVRAVEVLEHVGTPEARAVLQELARGAAEALRTREAKAARERLDRLSSAQP